MRVVLAEVMFPAFLACSVFPLFHPHMHRNTTHFSIVSTSGSRLFSNPWSYRDAVFLGL